MSPENSEPRGNEAVLTNPLSNHMPEKKWWQKINFKRKTRKPDLNLLDQVEVLLINTGEAPSDAVIGKCKDLMALHRIKENTDARRRLEKWASRAIVYYLIAVGIIILLNDSDFSISFSFFKWTSKLDLSDMVLVTLLSTTTINILGLGFIVLKGHFKASEINISSENPLASENNEVSVKKGITATIRHEIINN